MELPIGFGVKGTHPREWVIIPDKSIYVLKNSGLEWFEKSRKVWRTECL